MKSYASKFAAGLYNSIFVNHRTTIVGVLGGFMSFLSYVQSSETPISNWGFGEWGRALLTAFGFVGLGAAAHDGALGSSKPATLVDKKLERIPPHRE